MPFTLYFGTKTLRMAWNNFGIWGRWVCLQRGLPEALRRMQGVSLLIARPSVSIVISIR